MGRFEVDRRGLAALLDAKGKSWIVHELIQNAWDEDYVTEVEVTLEALPNRAAARLTVRDDSPNGFQDLTHAYTLFASSYKKGDPTKRGRFNLGEKFVLALALDAEISTTTGTIVFDGEHRSVSPRKTATGSVVTATFRLTHAETAEIQAGITSLIPPKGIVTTFNGTPLAQRSPVATFEWSLPTEIADSEGTLRPTERKASVHLYNPLPGESASIYECGIPVVETGDRWHVDVQQKVPLNMQRDNVRPSYLRLIRTLALNAMHKDLEVEDFTSSWVLQAVQDKRVEIEAVASYMDAKYGANRVAADPTNPESMSVAAASGFAIVQGRSENALTWAKIREGNLARPAGQIFPASVERLDAAKIIKKADWTPNIRNVVGYCQMIGKRLLGVSIKVCVINDSSSGVLAAYGKGGQLTLNAGRLGWSWFRPEGSWTQINELMIHEFAHEFSSNHLSSVYYDALCRLGAKLVQLALDEPKLWHEFEGS